MKPYSNIISPLPDVMLLNGYDLNASGEITKIHGLRRLLETLGQTLVSSKNTTRLTGGDIMFLRHQLSLTEPELAKLLGTNGDKIFKWELDKAPIDLSAEHLLRTIAAQQLAIQQGSRSSFSVTNYLTTLTNARTKNGEAPRATYYVQYDERTYDWSLTQAPATAAA